MIVKNERMVDGYNMDIQSPSVYVVKCAGARMVVC